MTAEKIIEQIKKDSEKEINQILKEAKQQASEIIKEAKEEAQQEFEKILSDGKKQAQNIKRILISKANQDTKRELMNAREKIIEECFLKAHHKLSILKGPRYNKIIKKLIDDGRKKLGEKGSLFVTREAGKKIATELGIKIDGYVESSGGVVLKSTDGRIILDHTFDGILKREKDKMRPMVGNILFS
jgi:V/A-type H+-transporting ATPase subunit E